MGARYGQKLRRVRKWLHSDPLANPRVARGPMPPFWTILDPPLWHACGDLTPLTFCLVD